jgi:hypothetical protein
MMAQWNTGKRPSAGAGYTVRWPISEPQTPAPVL